MNCEKSCHYRDTPGMQSCLAAYENPRKLFQVAPNDEGRFTVNISSGDIRPAASSCEQRLDGLHSTSHRRESQIGNDLHDSRGGAMLDKLPSRRCANTKPGSVRSLRTQQCALSQCQRTSSVAISSGRQDSFETKTDMSVDCSNCQRKNSGASAPKKSANFGCANKPLWRV